MSVIGSLVVNVSADIGGFVRGAKQVSAAAKEVGAGTLEMDVRFRALRQGARAIQSVVSHVQELAEESRRTGLSLEQLSHGLVSEETVRNVDHMTAAFQDLVDTVKSLAAGGPSGSIAKFFADAFDENIALLTGTTVEIVRGDRAMREHLKQSSAQKEKDNKESLARREAQAQEYLASQKRVAAELARLRDENFALTQGEDAGKLRKFAEDNPTKAAFDEFRAQLAENNRLNAAKKAADEAELQRKEQIKEAEQAAAHAREDAEKRAAQLFEETLTPQEKYVAKLWEIHDLAKAGLIDETTFRRANRAAREERDKATRIDPREDRGEVAAGASALERGSQEAFAALSRFARGNDQSKIPEKQLGELQKINRELIRRRDTEPAVQESF